MSINLCIVLWGLTLMLLGQPLYFYDNILEISDYIYIETVLCKDGHKSVNKGFSLQQNV